MNLVRTVVHALSLVTLLGMMAAMAHAEEPTLLTVSAPNKGMEEVTRDLIQSIGTHNYSFVRQQSIDSRLVPQEWESADTRVVYFCNFAQMNRALALDARAAQFLPCRVTLFQTRNGIEMVAINPAWVSERLNNPVLHVDCIKLKQDYLDIMNEAAL
jgi:cytochrome c oxidase cbb3-type subunit 3